MNHISMRFYGELNDFLHRDQRNVAFLHYYNEQPSVKDVIESLGVPHTEIDLLLINGDTVGFSYKLQGGERVAVYPRFKNFDVAAFSRVKPKPLPVTRFVLDVHLGKLASYLRMVGFDTQYSNQATNNQLIDVSASDNRILLTFNRELLKRKKLVYGYHVRSKDPVLQLAEVLERFDLLDQLHPFVRCMLCNGLLLPVSKEDVLSSLPEKVQESLDEFFRCQKCGHIYWKGTHYEHMNDFIAEIKEMSISK